MNEAIPDLPSLYRANHYSVLLSSEYLLVGFKPGDVSFIVKEIWNREPFTREDAERLYAEMVKAGNAYDCRYFRVVAHGGYTADALAFELHGLTVSDDSYVDRLASGRHVELFAYNETAYRAIEKGFETCRIGAVVQATGTGKSYLLARYIMNHSADRILVIAPNITILDEIRHALPCIVPTVMFSTFQSLVYLRKGKKTLPADHILIDEFHHFGAEVWGESIREVIENNPQARVLGTSATPIRPKGMLDTVDVYFEGNLFYELSLSQAWYYGILPVPVLVQSVYGLNDELDRLQRLLDHSACSVKKRNTLQRKLDKIRMDFKASWGASSLIRKFLPSAVRKLLVFCKDRSDLEGMKPQVLEWLEAAGFRTRAFEVHNGKSEKKNQAALAAFRRHTSRLHVLFSINMLMEGLHVEGVDAALFLRRTESYIVTFQQLGRCLKAGSKHRPVILDFVNNLSGKSVYDVMACDYERLSLIPSPRGFEGVTDFQVTGFVADIRKRVEEILADLEPWQVMYERLITYRSEENDWPSVSEGKLGLWCNTQRISKKRGRLSSQRIELLDRIGFEWERHDSRWTQNYEALKVFYQIHRTWPKRGEGALSIWCNTQRQSRKNGKLTKERIRKLDAIHFVWEQDLDQEWLEKYESLKTFYLTCNRWPKAKEGSLGAWCCTQRKSYKQGTLSSERTGLLDKLGFPWSMDSRWMENFKKLQDFYREKAHWPNSREGLLGSWCFVQRRRYRSGKLSDERIRRLESIGFEW